MSITPPVRVSDAFADREGRQVVLFVGAGISLWSPSSLPTWGEFNQVVLGEATERAARKLKQDSEEQRAVAALNVADVGSKTLSNALVEILAGEKYFEMVRALDGKQPNEAHRAVARLVRRGVVAAIVTTNFDTLIEQALREAGVPFAVQAGPADYDREKPAGTAVYKIHGSAGANSTLIDTVSQKLRGIDPHVRAALTALFEKYQVVVIGYSGGDLEFGADYLALRCVPAGTRRIDWVTRPEERDHIDPNTAALVHDRGQFVMLTMADALEALGAGPMTLEWDAAERAMRVEELRDQAVDLYARLGNVNALALCMRLLSSSGRTAVASTIWRHLARSIDRRKTRSLVALEPAVRALAAEGHRLFGVQEQRKWACRQIQDVRRRREGTGRDGTSAAMERDARSEARACLLLGDAMVRMGRFEQAGMAIQRALESCEYLADITLLPGVYRLYGWRAKTRFERLLRPEHSEGRLFRLRDVTNEYVAEIIRTEDTAFGYLTAAEAAGLVAGNVDALDSAWLRAELLQELGEYDAALVCLERLELRMGLGLHRETAVRTETLKGDIAFRQGKYQQAMARWNDCLSGIARGNPYLAAYVRNAIVVNIGVAPEWRGVVIEHCDELLRAMERGELPVGGETDLVWTRPALELVKKNLHALGSEPIDPIFIKRLEQDSGEQYGRWPQYFARQRLVYREFHGDTDGVLDALDELVAREYESQRGSRALEAANAHVRRAQQDGNSDQQFAAQANLAAIRSWLGDTVDAPQWFSQAMSDQRAADPVVRSGLERRLPHYFWDTDEPAAGTFPRGMELDLDDALAMKWQAPPTGAEREQKAVRAFGQNNFVMGRIFALQAIEAYRAEGLPGGLERSYRLLQMAAEHEVRSYVQLSDLCIG
jgi:tetratricopeptide (TPR) repeat protein